MSEPLLQVRNLRVNFKHEGREFSAVEGISFHVEAGETLGVVGESGCGKSITALSLMRLVPSPPGRIVEGQIYYQGKDLLKCKESEMRQIRGNDISMIFQEPMTALNPVFRIGKQMDEVVQLHNNISKPQVKQRSIEMLKTVGIAHAEQIYASYPFQLSGGMRQRVMIAMGLACQPKLLIADEPTTALDVTIQAQILDLMRGLKEKTQTAILFITHDLGVVAEMCDRVIVMYAGQIVEEADVDSLFNDPKHPYTQGLLDSIPKIDEKRARLFSIPGQVPLAGSIVQGCRFADRCNRVMERCRVEDPALIDVGVKHQCRCWLHEEQGNLA